MDNIKKVLYDGCILKLKNKNKDNFNYEVEKDKWKNSSNAIFHYKTWIISFSPNEITNPDTIKNHEESEHKEENKKNENSIKVKGWEKKDENFIFDDNVLKYFQEQKFLKIDTDETEKYDDFSVTLVGNTYDINSSKPFEIRLGRKFSAFAFDKCLNTMEIGEKSLFLCTPHTMMAYNKMEVILRQIDYKKNFLKNEKLYNEGNNSEITNLLKNHKNQLEIKYHALTRENLVFILELKLIEIQAPESYQKIIWEMNDEEKYNYATNLKNGGNDLFKSSDYINASIKFQEALSIFKNLIHSGTMLNEHFEKLSTNKTKNVKENENKETKENENSLYTLDDLISMSNICLLNFSACQLKLKNYESVVEHCSEVLQNDPENVKAFYRRGKAYSLMNSKLELAKKDFNRLMEIYIKNLKVEEDMPSLTSSLKINYKNEIKNLNAELKLLEKKIKQQNNQEKSFFSKMFMQ